MAEYREWGQLVSLTDIETQPIALATDKFTIGRALDCDLCLSENKLVSGRHCHIERDSEGNVRLHDSSTNGTLLNLEYKVTKGKAKELQHGDEFYIVFKKNNQASNVGYVYQDMAALEAEEGTQEGTQEYSAPDLMDATLEDSDVNDAVPAETMNKRKSEQDGDAADACTSIKRQKTDPGEPTTTKQNNDVKPSEQPAQAAVKDTTVDKGGEECDKTSTKSDPAEPIKSGSTEKSGDGDKVKADPLQKDDIEENLQCMICQEIMHDCVSLQPCLHTYCAGCYSDWMSRSNECPSCRKKVRRINKNHIVNNLIEAYLRSNPEKKRPEEDTKELDDKNKITKNMLYPKDAHKDYSDSSDYSDSEEEETPAPPAPIFAPLPRMPAPVIVPAPAPQLFGFGTPLFGVMRPNKTVCRQCPEYKDPLDAGTGIIGGLKTAINTVKNIVVGGGDASTSTGDTGDPKPSTSTGDDASTSGEKPKLHYKDDPKVMPDPQTHVCGPLQNHVLCQCCMQPMPDVRTVYFQQPTVTRPQQCQMCYRAYCHAYWGCRKADCLGCIGQFKEMNFGRKVLLGLILDNQQESEIFKNYIDSHDMSVKDVLTECCQRMEAGIFTVPAQLNANFKTTTVVCYACGINNFRQLALQYRKTLKKEDFPEAVRNRPDCYWGSGCRTQKNKPHHAMNFNHICDQTRKF